MPLTYAPPALEKIEAARERIAGTVLRTPLVRLQAEQAPAEIYLKLEYLQPMGSFKVRGAGNALALVGNDLLVNGLWTASAGNMAQAVAWHARERGVACRVVVPETAPDTKLDAVTRLGGGSCRSRRRRGSTSSEAASTRESTDTSCTRSAIRR